MAFDPLSLIPVFGGLVSSIVDATAGRDEREKQLKMQQEEQARAEREARKPKFQPFEPIDMAALTQTANLDPGGGARGMGPQQYQMEALRRMRS